MLAKSWHVRKAWLVKRKFVALLASFAVALGVTLGTAIPAYAWDRGNVWVMFGDSNCPAGGSVVGIYWGVDGFSSGPPGGDWGDNIIYPEVRVGSNSYNWLSYTLYCDAWWRTQYRSVTSQKYLSPYESNLNFWY